MGNYRSGRWRHYEKSITVEDCPDILDIRFWTRKNILQPGIYRRDRWTSFWGAQDITSLTAKVNTFDMTFPWIRVFYFLDAHGPTTYRIALQLTYPHFGGLRWWFTCPVSVNGIPCRRRVSILYRPSGARYFACRSCHQMTYVSCQESHKYDKVYQWLATQHPGMTAKAAKRTFG